MEVLNEPQRYAPEQVFYIKKLTPGTNGLAHFMLSRREGDGFSITYDPVAMPHAIRWILDNGDQRVAAFAIPGTCEPKAIRQRRKRAMSARSQAELARRSPRASAASIDAARPISPARSRSLQKGPDMTGRIAVVGSNMVDLITYVTRMPAKGETIEAPSFEMGCGGKGANQAVAAAKLGADVLMVTKVGDDLFGENTIRNFASFGIDTRHVSKVAGKSSGVAPIVVEPSGENSILIVKGANADLLPVDIERAAEDLKTCDLILLQLEIPLETVYATIEFGKRHGIKTLLNPAPATSALDLQRILRVSFFVPNETELALLAGLPVGTFPEIEAAARSLIAKGIETVIVTMGERGALLVTPTETTAIEPVRVTPVDTTGAGDAFIGSFARYYVDAGDVNASLRKAVRYAADSVTRRGTQKAYATREMFEAH
jgi:ribokinase